MGDVFERADAARGGDARRRPPGNLARRFQVRPFQTAIARNVCVDDPLDAEGGDLAGQIHRINHRETLRLRERIVTVLRLHALFGLDPGPPDERRYVVIVGRGDKRVGIVVDRLKGQQEVVIKALDPAVTGEPPVVAGATIMGDGRVVLILDVAVLFEGKRQALRGRGEPEAEALAEGGRS